LRTCIAKPQLSSSSLLVAGLLSYHKLQGTIISNYYHHYYDHHHYYHHHHQNHFQSLAEDVWDVLGEDYVMGVAPNHPKFENFGD
jgi:hypothetical protein